MRKADPLPLDMPQPDNVVQAWVDSRTGQGSDANCPGAVQMPYIRGSEPPPGAACASETPASGESVMDWVKGWMN
jgi:penicillin-binding protein 1B